jgi:hypothetical protein
LEYNSAYKEVVDVDLIGAAPTKEKGSFQGRGINDSHSGRATIAPADNLSKAV